ncbi:response regulator transcription factor [Aliikangiella coralliicola]|uniref:Response regulator transcription factor n=1 Tax=Aliikangiella coralliicola TaxID=2592383 RepID=A0A545UJ37_9GAMM|nr:response regulator transcription factor [Aliikangiella coralliicola]TQV89476.1 response regulator transcription factor [Aliikangiella coralliicola]
MNRILVVEDDPEISEPLLRLLEANNFQVLHCFSGEQVFPAIAQFKPSLILLDIVLPVIDGLQICQDVRLNSDIPIIIMSAKASYSDRLDGFKMGADDFVCKPFSMSELVLRINSVMKRSKSRIS